MKEAALGWAERGGYPRPKSLVQVPDGPGARRNTGYPLSEDLESLRNTGYPRPKSLVQVPDGPGARRSTGYPLSEALERRPKPRLKLRAKLRAKLRP